MIYSGRMKVMRAKRNSNLDEQQEQTLLKIEHNGCWLVFWGLLAVMVVQQFAFGPDFKTIIGEWIVFMVLALYLAFACMRNGIWDRHLEPNSNTNLKVSLIAALASGIIVFGITYSRFRDFILGSVIAGGFTAVIVLVLCFVSLQLSAVSYKKRREKMDAEPEENDETEE
jgi:cation transport ATPase